MHADIVALSIGGLLLGISNIIHYLFGGHHKK